MILVLILHNYLSHERVTLSKDKDENSENCWNSLIAPLTTTWLETASVNVLKLAEIGQSAAEVPPRQLEEQGSETMHGTPKIK